MSEKEDLHISQGVTMKLIFLGVVLLIGAGFVYHFFGVLLSLPIIYLGLVFFLSIKGTVFSQKENAVKIYLSFFLFKISVKHKMSMYNKVLLTPFSESSTYMLRAVSSTIRTKSFDLYLVSIKNQNLLVKEFSDYNDALEAMNTISQYFSLESEDLYTEKMESIQARRSVRERR